MTGGSAENGLFCRGALKSILALLPRNSSIIYSEERRTAKIAPDRAEGAGNAARRAGKITEK